MTEDLDLLIAWAAGIFEGEGAISMRAVHVNQKDPWLLHRLQENFGGTVGCKRKKDGCWQWWVCGQNGRDFVKAILPYLSPRRLAQIDAIFINDEKRSRMRDSVKEAARLHSRLRGRDFGRFNHAKIS